MKKIYQSGICLTLAGALTLLPVGVACATTQDESVYVKLQESGEVKQISVIKHLINDSSEQVLQDISSLEKIENLNGFETFTQDKENIEWKAEGKDIYYRGESQKDLPVKLKVSYKLDNEEKSLEEILGKSGRVEIRLKYTNLSKSGNLYTPFVAAMTTTLSEGKAMNVEVKNGKVTSNGRNIIVAGVAAPGLYESLGIDELKGCDEIVISFDTEEFELNDIYSIVTPKILDDLDLKTFSELDDLYASADKLAASSRQLVNGANQLSNGIGELKAGILEAKSKLTAQKNLLDAKTLAKIKTTAGNAAEKQVEAQRATIAAGIKKQVESNATLMQALDLEAGEICKTKTGGASCPQEMLAKIKSQLVAGVEKNMTDASVSLAKTTARQTAESTAVNTAQQVAASLQENMIPAMTQALDTILAGVNKLANGADELKNGMVKFDREGIQTLQNFVNGKIKVTANKIQQLTKLADQYTNYSGMSKTTQDGTTKFILMIEGRKSE